METFKGVGHGLIPVAAHPKQEVAAIPTQNVGVLPLDWFIRTLAPASPYLRILNKAMVGAAYDSAVLTEVQIGEVAIPSGVAWVLTSFGFFAEEPNLGSHLTLLPPNALMGYVTFRIDTGEGGMFRGGYNVANANFSGAPMLDDDFRFYERVPLYLFGDVTLRAFYTTVAAPPFPVARIGFKLGGFEISQATLKEKLNELALK